MEIELQQLEGFLEDRSLNEIEIDLELNFCVSLGKDSFEKLKV